MHYVYIVYIACKTQKYKLKNNTSKTLFVSHEEETY